MSSTPADLAPGSAPPGGEALRARKKREIRIASRHRGGLAVRIVIEALWGLAGWTAVIALAVAGVLPYWAACLVNGWFAYLMYMPLHEATHGNVSGRHARLRWLDDLIGSLSAIPLWFGYRSHRISHMKHHAYTNDPARDPDHFVAGPFLGLFPKFGLLVALQVLVPVLSLVPGGMRILPASVRSLRNEAEEGMDPLELAYQRRFQRGCLAAFAALSLAGHFPEAFWLWFVPSRIGLFLILAVFAWLPHHPHAERGRYRDTRITLFPFGTLLIRGQNHHLLHHMFPRVPHYRLPALFAELRPILVANGARIEGPLAGPGAPSILLRWDEPMRAATGAPAPGSAAADRGLG